MSEGGNASVWRPVLADFAYAILFFCLLTPLAVVLRLCGCDRLRRHLDPRATSYWIARNPAQGRQTWMTRQR